MGGSLLPALQNFSNIKVYVDIVALPIAATIDSVEPRTALQPPTWSSTCCYLRWPHPKTHPRAEDVPWRGLDVRDGRLGNSLSRPLLGKHLARFEQTMPAPCTITPRASTVATTGLCRPLQGCRSCLLFLYTKSWRRCWRTNSRCNLTGLEHESVSDACASLLGPPAETFLPLSTPRR